MPWSVEREGKSLRVEISEPIHGWETLIRRVDANMTPAPDVVYLPRTLPQATREDNQILRMLWAALHVRGLSVVATEDVEPIRKVGRSR